MDSLCSISQFPFSHGPPSKPYSSSFVPSKSIIPFSTRSSSSSSSFAPSKSTIPFSTRSPSSVSSPAPPKTIRSSLKPVVVTVVAASAATVALLSGRTSDNHCLFSSLAHAAAAVVDDTKQREAAVEEKKIVDDSASKRIESLQAEMEAKVKGGKVPEAIAIMDDMISLQPEDKDLFLLKAHLYTHEGNFEAAKAVFEEVLRKDPVTVEAYHGLVLIASQTQEDADKEEGDGELDRVLERIAVAVETCRNENRNLELRDFMLLVAQIKVMEGEYDEALGIYRELVSEEPRDFRPYLCQGIIYTLLRKKDEAEKQFETYRRLVPKGHPYAQYFEENMALMKAIGQKQDNKRTGVLKS